MTTRKLVTICGIVCVVCCCGMAPTKHNIRKLTNRQIEQYHNGAIGREWFDAMMIEHKAVYKQPSPLDAVLENKTLSSALTAVLIFWRVYNVIRAKKNGNGMETKIAQAVASAIKNGGAT